MGKFKRNKTYMLAWDDGEFEGLEVVVRSMSVGRYFAIMEKMRDGESQRAALEGFAEFLISWNLEDENDQPVPATREGIMSVDLDLITAVIQAWQREVTGSNVPKDGTSSSGPPLVEASLPMETSFESLAI